MEVLNNLVNYLTTLLQDGGIIFGILLILLESIIPALPLGVFVALNINAFGLIIGILISWLSTCLGCYISFLIFSYLSKKWIYKHFKKEKMKKILRKMKNIEFSNLVVIIALPFIPAFLINIAAGIVGMKKRKFLIALITGKIFMIVFWGCIGKSMIESITDIKTLMIVTLFILLAFVISKIISKKMKIE